MKSIIAKVWPWLLCALVMIMVPVFAAVAQETPDLGYEGHLAEIIATVAAFVTSIILGVIKKYTTWLDGKWTSLIKPIQPVIVAAMAILIPYLAQWLGTDLGDPNNWANGPAVALVVVVLREIKEAIKKLLGGDEAPA